MLLLLIYGAMKSYLRGLVKSRIISSYFSSMYSGSASIAAPPLESFPLGGAAFGGSFPPLAATG